MRVAPGAGTVDPARRDRAADDEDAFVRRFHRVVRTRKQLDVGARSDVLAVRSELRQPVAVQVRLVAHDVLTDARNALDDVGREARELVACRGGQGRCAAAEVHQRRDDANAEEVAGGGNRLERRELSGRDRGLTGLPDRRDPDRVEARRFGQLHLGHGHGRVGVSALVLGGAHVHPVAPERVGRHGQGRESAEQCYERSRVRQEVSPGLGMTMPRTASVGRGPEGVNPEPTWRQDPSAWGTALLGCNRY